MYLYYILFVNMLSQCTKQCETNLAQNKGKKKKEKGKEKAQAQKPTFSHFRCVGFPLLFIYACFSHYSYTF